ncbi:hypothetical protein EDC91_104113 [Shewanella fodinae]|uniref:Uncharacterized protein n=1 Tax=Shewanella fodinae TaxID=552357 RepID=A0A4R2FEL7_9GAMM|nr:hypothetical protein EDC91_104113 [Shewanella fodinae]
MGVKESDVKASDRRCIEGTFSGGNDLEDDYQWSHFYTPFADGHLGLTLGERQPVDVENMPELHILWLIP